MTGLLALDLDGTILLAGEQLVPGIREEIQAWRAGGWWVAIITARHRKLPLIDSLGVDAYTCDYGAQIFAQGQEIQRRTLPPKVVEEAVAAMPSGARRVVLTPDSSFVSTLSRPDDRPLQEWRTGRDFVKLLLEHPDASAVQETAGHWAELPDATVIWEQANSCMLVAAGADKGNALQTLACHFGVPLERTVAAGDCFPDETMLHRAGQFLTVGQNPALRGGHFFAERPADVPARLAAIRRHWLGQ